MIIVWSWAGFGSFKKACVLRWLSTPNPESRMRKRKRTERDWFDRAPQPKLSRQSQARVVGLLALLCRSVLQEVLTRKEGFGDVK